MPGMNRKQKKALRRIIISAVLLLIVNIIKLPIIISTAIYAAAYFVIGRELLRKAFLGIINGRVLDENFLMAFATVGAIVLAAADKSYDFNEAVFVMLFYQIGELFQSYAVGKSRRSISELMDIRPDYANLERDGELITADPDEVAVGSVIVCRPGERIPIDGVVIEGSSSVDTSALTGESLPRGLEPGDEVISGCINLSGLIRVRTTKEFGQSTAAKILELVEESASRKAKSEEFISKFARVYTPAVCAAALALAVIPPVFGLAAGSSPDWEAWIYRALTFLVISCPCALVISIPLAFFAGIGGASREGILIKGSNYLETLSKVSTVVFDKTGTLTQGAFEVSGIHRCTMDEETLIEYAALAESASSHPISLSLRRRYGKEPDRSRVGDIREISGKGVVAQVDGKQIAAGNEKLMEMFGVRPCPCEMPGTLVHVAVDGEHAGHIHISDKLKSGAKEAVDRLKSGGAARTVMLTGDSDTAARSAAEELGIDECHSGLLPADKVAKVEELLSAQKEGEKLAFVGDGINDAPVLARADIGIAMGALGSDAAIEAADVVLMDDDPRKVFKAISISRKCLSIVYQNIVFALAVKFICLVAGALGYAGMWAAIFADVGVMVIAVLNSVRALNTKNV